MSKDRQIHQKQQIGKGTTCNGDLKSQSTKEMKISTRILS